MKVAYSFMLKIWVIGKLELLVEEKLIDFGFFMVLKCWYVDYCCYVYIYYSFIHCLIDVC